MRPTPPQHATLPRLAAGLLLAVAFAAAAHAEDIRLRNGQHIQGKIVRETQTGILVRLDTKSEIHIAFSEIAEIRREGEVVEGDAPIVSEAETRDRQRERAIVRDYTQKFEVEYRRRHPKVVRIPYVDRRTQCDPVHVAQEYGLPVTEAASSHELAHMFELALRAYRSDGAQAWRMTLAYYRKPRDVYIRAIERNVDLANLYLDQPDLPTLLHLRE